MAKLNTRGRSKKSGMASSLLRARRRHARIEQVNRRKIIIRDNSTCYMCHRKLSYAEVIIEHVVPLCRGGSHSEDNLRVACPPCNRRKGTKLVAECEWLKANTGELVIKKV
jgi:5-methylcytosine-specific restriction endonuclease McrA